MDTIKIWDNSLSDKQAQSVAARLARGELMIYPTDTLYAIGCDALNIKAIERLCRIQSINPDKVRLSIICKDISQAAEYARIDNKCFRLLKENTPGAFTFIFKTTGSLPKAFKGRKEVGIRIPQCKAAVQAVEALGTPILTSSLHLDDDLIAEPSLIAEKYQNQADLMLMGNPADSEPSTIIDCTNTEPEILRQGKGKLF